MNLKFETPKLILISLLCLILISCSKENNEVIENETSKLLLTGNVSHSEIETEILNLVNSHRENLGLPVLSPLNIVSGVADGHTNYMIEVGEINHDNFDERTQLLMENAGAKTVGENVAYGYSTAESVLKGWLNSEPHKKVIESQSYTHFGISTESDTNGKNYFTQIFIRK